MDTAKEGWFTELSTLWPGQGLSFRVSDTLFRGKSEYQDIAVYETEAFGRVLVLDGVIQATDYDEFSYQEMLVHLPLQALAAPPRRVLVVGGGDGGVLRELTRYASLEEIHIAELDGMVIETAKKFMPKMAVGFADPRVHVHVGDGLAFVAQAAPDSFDAIIVDSSDPVGPAEVLFQRPFFESMRRAIRPGGVIATQAESVWLHMNIIEALHAMCKSVFESVQYGYTTIPTYPSGQIGFMMCAKGADTPVNFREPSGALPVPEGLRFYHPDMHRAAFILPAFAKEKLG